MRRDATCTRDDEVGPWSGKTCARGGGEGLPAGGQPKPGVPNQISLDRPRESRDNCDMRRRGWPSGLHQEGEIMADDHIPTAAGIRDVRHTLCSVDAKKSKRLWGEMAAVPH